MIRARIIILAIIIGLVQISLHAMDTNWVIPNLVLIFVVWFAPKLDYLPMTMLVILLSVLVEMGSLLPVGIITLSLFLVMLASKLVFRGSYDTDKWTFQLALVAVATVVFNLIFYATLPGEAMIGRLGYAGIRILLEVLYNSVILLLVVGLSDRRIQTHQHYRLPQ